MWTKLRHLLLEVGGGYMFRGSSIALGATLCFAFASLGIAETQWRSTPLPDISAVIKDGAFSLEMSCVADFFQTIVWVPSTEGYGDVSKRSVVHIKIEIDKGQASAKSAIVKSDSFTNTEFGDALVMAYRQNGLKLADLAARAVETITVSVSPDAEVDDPEFYEVATVPAKGAAGAILDVRDNCKGAAVEAIQDEVQSPASSEWTVSIEESSGLAFEAMAVSSNNASLYFGCYAQGATFGFSILETLLDPSLVGRDLIDVAIVIDPKGTRPLRPKYTDLAQRVIGDRVHFRFVGSLVQSWASLAMRANSEIQIGLSADAATAEVKDLLNLESFTAKGSTAAIRAAIVDCKPLPE
jgi:hypothetical protein